MSNTNEAVERAITNARENVQERRALGHDAVWLACDTVETLLAALTQQPTPSAPERVEADRKREVAINMRAQAEYLSDYQFRGDGGDYTPNEQERLLLVDALAGWEADRDQWLKDAALTQQPTPSAPERVEADHSSDLRRMVAALEKVAGYVTGSSLASQQVLVEIAREALQSHSAEKGEG